MLQDTKTFRKFIKPNRRKESDFMINIYLESTLNELIQEKKNLKKEKLKSIFWLREPAFIVKKRHIDIKTVNDLINITKREIDKIKKVTYTNLSQTLNLFEKDPEGLLEFTIRENKKQLQGYLSSLSEVTYRNWFVIKNLNDRLIVVSRFLNKTHEKIVWKERVN